MRKEATSFQSDKPYLTLTTRHVSELTKSVKALFWTCFWETTWSTTTSTLLIIWSKRPLSHNRNLTTSSASTYFTQGELRPLEDNTLTPCRDWTKQSESPLTTPRDSRFSVKKSPSLSNFYKGRFPTEKSSPTICTSRMPILTTSSSRWFWKDSWKTSTQLWNNSRTLSKGTSFTTSFWDSTKSW